MVAMPQPNEQSETLLMNVAEYLEFTTTQEGKYEYVSGQVRAMTGGSLRHNLIVANINTALNNHLRERDCLVPDSNTRLSVQSNDVSFRYPDVMVICGEPQYFDNRVDTLTNPLILVEVLSPSTQITDRNEKLEEYLKIDTLREFILVSQEQVKVEMYHRDADGSWRFALVDDLRQTMTIPSINYDLALEDVYLKISFDAD